MILKLKVPHSENPPVSGKPRQWVTLLIGPLSLEHRELQLWEVCFNCLMIISFSFNLFRYNHISDAKSLD